MKLALVLIRMMRRLAPAALRDRWSEEWQAEIEHAAAATFGRPRRTARLLRFAVGSIADVISLHRLPPSALRDRPPRLQDIGRDFRFARRSLAATPAFTATVVGSLSIGVAVMAGTYAYVNAAHFPMLPGIADQARLIEVIAEPSTFDDGEAIRERVPELTAVTSMLFRRLAVDVSGQAMSVGGAFVPTNYFDVLGARLQSGRGFGLRENRHGDAAVVVVGPALAKRMFGGAAVGRTMTVSGRPVEIVGVAADGFAGTLGSGARLEIWLPAAMAAELAAPAVDDGRAMRQGEYQITHIARVVAASRIDGALARVREEAALLASTRVERPLRAFTVARRVGRRSETSEVTIEIAIGMLVPLVVLLIGCINAANLLLARGTQRLRDTAVRVALGASRWRVTRYLLAECVLLALAAAIVTVPLLVGMLAALEAEVPLRATVDLRVVAFAFGVSLASVFAFGLLPALRLARGPSSLGSARSAETLQRSRLRRGLVAVQVALSLGLLAMGGQVMTAVGQSMGFTGAGDPSTLVMASFDLTQMQASPVTSDFYQSLLERVERLPGVARAGLARPEAVWTFGRGKGQSPVIVWLPGSSPKESKLIIGGYAGGALIEAVGMDLVDGRLFEPSDRRGSPRVAIINRTAANDYFGGAALGRLIRVAARTQPYEASREVEIVGVIEPALEPSYVGDPENPTQPAVYLPAPLEPEPALALYVRALGEASRVMPQIRRAAAQVDARVPVLDMATLQERQHTRYLEGRLMANGLALLGLLGLGLASSGLYGLVAFMVAMRRREIGVRMALGAHPRGILRLMLGEGLRIALIGAALGGAIAIVGSVLVRANMYGVGPLDIVALAVTTALLSVVVLVATLIPARTASRVDPLVVLRDE